MSLKTYHVALAAIEPCLKTIAEHERGLALADVGTLKKARAIVAMYQRTIAAYEAQCEQRERARISGKAGRENGPHMASR